MPAKHSKAAGNRAYYRENTDNGSKKMRLGTESQLPFGYCTLSLKPIEEGVLSPSGNLYSKEAILEYLLTKTKEIKELKALEEMELVKQEVDEATKQAEIEDKKLQKFSDTQGIDGIVKRKATEIIENSEYYQSRKKHIDDTDKSTKLSQLQQVCPWVPQFTPTAEPSKRKEIPKRPSSPFSGQPLRAKDLIPIDLLPENAEDKNSGPTRYICPVSRKTITNQKVIFIKSTGAYMIDAIADELAYPTMTCPMTGKKFSKKDVMELTQAASGFASTGKVEATKYGLTIT